MINGIFKTICAGAVPTFVSGLVPTNNYIFGVDWGGPSYSAAYSATRVGGVLTDIKFLNCDVVENPVNKCCRFISDWKKVTVPAKLGTKEDIENLSGYPEDEIEKCMFEELTEAMG